MSAIVMGYEWSTHDHGISQNGRKAQQKSQLAHLTDRNQGETRLIRLIAPGNEMPPPTWPKN